MILRDFLYLDRPLVRSFLAQLEGGNVDELTERETSLGSATLGGKLGAGIAGVNGAKSTERSKQSEAVLKQVAASELDRLVSHLQDDDLRVISYIDVVEDYSGIARKQFLEIDARISVSGFQQLQDLVGKISGLLPTLEQSSPTPLVDTSTIAAMRGISSLGALEGKLPVLGTVAGTANYRIGLELDPAHVNVDKWDLDATILLKVQRVLQPGESQIVGNPMGGLLALMDEDDRQKFTTSLAAPELRQFGVTGDNEIRFPGLVATPIAIYR